MTSGVVTKENLRLRAECEAIGKVKWNIAFARLKLGWPKKEAFTIKDRPYHSSFQKKYGMTKAKYCELNNIDHYETFCQRLSVGMSIEEASKPPYYYKNKDKVIRLVKYKGEEMGLYKAYRSLCEDTGAHITGRGGCIVIRSKVRKITLQEAFDYFVDLYNRKYKRG